MQTRRDVLIEACVETLDAAVAVVSGGAARLELCVDLAQGGITPSGGLIAECCMRAGVPVAVLVRPRAGDFTYTAGELRIMRRDIELCRQFGAHAVVFGALTAAGEVDCAAMRPLIDAARPMEVVFHRAFDAATDLDAALDSLMDLGIDRVLTSGGAPTALLGAPTLRNLARRAGDRIQILAGGKIRPENAAEVVAGSGVRELHFRATTAAGVRAVIAALG